MPLNIHNILGVGNLFQIKINLYTSIAINKSNTRQKILNLWTAGNKHGLAYLPVHSLRMEMCFGGVDLGGGLKGGDGIFLQLYTLKI